MSSSTPSQFVSVTVTEQDGVYTAHYDPALPRISTTTVIQYTLETEGWKFGEVTLTPPLSAFDSISETQFNITDDGSDTGTFTFKVILIQTDPHRGQQPEQIDTDPEVVNGPA